MNSLTACIVSKFIARCLDNSLFVYQDELEEKAKIKPKDDVESEELPAGMGWGEDMESEELPAGMGGEMMWS